MRTLPPPRMDSSMSLEAALTGRRTIRDLQPHALGDHEIGQLLWAAQGVTDESGRRTAPSASATFPLELYTATAAGMDHYLPAEHALEHLDDADLRAGLQAATGDQPFVGTAPLIVIISAFTSRVAPRHGPERAIRYADLEAGHAGQNLLLQAVALDLAGVPIGSFHDAEVSRLLRLPVEESPLYLFAIGHPR
jgi:SagB-type dehydrogenase family enzyme